jgi:hypothetical protein
MSRSHLFAAIISRISVGPTDLSSSTQPFITAKDWDDVTSKTTMATCAKDTWLSGLTVQRVGRTQNAHICSAVVHARQMSHSTRPRRIPHIELHSPIAQDDYLVGQGCPLPPQPYTRQHHGFALHAEQNGAL